ncbi:hypothetical protein EFM27_12615, partial [Lactiplantibacillus plantarum]|nr:hypothetical protein [Lactiplantibacillus plantarum]
QLLKDGFVVNTILKEADLFCPNSVRINFTIYLITKFQASNLSFEAFGKQYGVSRHAVRQ